LRRRSKGILSLCPTCMTFQAARSESFGKNPTSHSVSLEPNLRILLLPWHREMRFPPPGQVLLPTRGEQLGLKLPPFSFQQPGVLCGPFQTKLSLKGGSLAGRFQIRSLLQPAVCLHRSYALQPSWPGTLLLVFRRILAE
jgi:hypothetical protein